MQSRIVYQSQARREADSAEAVVIHCCDHRFQQPFKEFLSEGLQLRSYALVAALGGGHFVPMEQALPKFASVGMQTLSFIVKRARPRRIILIGHDDCLFFKERVQFFHPQGDLNQKQVANLQKARNMLREQFPGLAVELYFADAQPSGAVQFVAIG